MKKTEVVSKVEGSKKTARKVRRRKINQIGECEIIRSVLGDEIEREPAHARFVSSEGKGAETRKENIAEVERHYVHCQQNAVRRSH